MTETYFIDKIANAKNTEFKMATGRRTESDPLPCKKLRTMGPQIMIEYYPSPGVTLVKWIHEDQIVKKPTTTL